MATIGVVVQTARLPAQACRHDAQACQAYCMPHAGQHNTGCGVVDYAAYLLSHFIQLSSSQVQPAIVTYDGGVAAHDLTDTLAPLIHPLCFNGQGADAAGSDEVIRRSERGGCTAARSQCGGTAAGKHQALQ